MNFTCSPWEALILQGLKEGAYNYTPSFTQQTFMELVRCQGLSSVLRTETGKTLSLFLKES
jgi:hypothetical protein